MLKSFFNNKNQLKAGAALSYVALGLNTLVALGITPFILRKLGQSEYGLYSLVISVIGYLTILDFGFGNAVVRYASKYKAEGRSSELPNLYGMFITIFIFISVLAIVIGVFLYLNVNELFDKTMSSDELSKARIMVLIMIFNLASTFAFTVYNSIITAFERFIFQKGIQVIRVILNALLIIIVLKLGFKSIGMVIVVTLLNLIVLLSNFLYCKSRLKVKIVYGKIDFTLLKEVAIYSFFIFLNFVIDKVYWSTGHFVLGAVISTTAVAVFAVAMQIQRLYMNFSMAISGVFLPRVTGLVSKGKSNEELSKLFNQTGRLQYALLSLVLFGFILFGRAFIEIWAGKEYADAYKLVLIILIPLTIPLIQNLGITILQAKNQLKFRSILYTIVAVLSLILQIFLVKKYGIIGSAIAIAIGLILGHIIIMNFYYSIKQELKILLFWKEILKMSIAPVIISFFTYIIIKLVDLSSLGNLVFSIFVYSFVYLFALWIFSLNSYERQLLKNFFLPRKNIK